MWVFTALADLESCLRSLRNTINATALVMPSHLQALEGCSLERCWDPLHLQRWPTTAEACGGGWASSSLVSERGSLWAHFGEHVALGVSRKTCLTTGGFQCLLLSEQWTIKKFVLLVMSSSLCECSERQGFFLWFQKRPLHNKVIPSKNGSASHFTQSRTQTCLQVIKCCRLTCPI